jgi:hypothetical protein
MSLSAAAVEAIRRLVHDLAAHSYSSIEADGRIGRLTQAELGTAVAKYGRTLVPLPSDGMNFVYSYPVKDKPGEFIVEVTLWTLEEGRSDLTLSLTVLDNPGELRLSIDDLHVL